MNMLDYSSSQIEEISTKECVETNGGSEVSDWILYVYGK